LVIEQLDDLIDDLEEVLAEGRRIPFSGHLLVDEERILDVIDRMRVAVPEEVKRARRVVQEQDRLLGEARARVQAVLEEQGLLAAVEEERTRLLAEAEQEAAGVRAGADEYAQQVLRDLEERLSGVLTSVRNGLDSLSE
jgi:cell division septum initiation protein DivIVA